MLFVTGGAGFIGANFVREWIELHQTPVVNIDKLTYAGHLDNLGAAKENSLHHFYKIDINEQARIHSLFNYHQPHAMIHFAAESHVDNSIADPEAFIRTNINGTFALLEASLAYWRSLPETTRDTFRFVHVSTDEVYGSLSPTDIPTDENAPYRPNSPYAASKAASDHLVRAYFHTYGLPIIITHCSNNYGPHQHIEKLIPRIIDFARQGKPLPIYGSGKQIRDWLHVSDHCDALRTILAHGKPGETYNIGAHNEQQNIDVVKKICALLDDLLPQSSYVPHEQLIRYVDDRPGHDQRYAIDAKKLRTTLNWVPKESFDTGLRKTVQWYLSQKK